MRPAQALPGRSPEPRCTISALAAEETARANTYRLHQLLHPLGVKVRMRIVSS